MTENPQENQVLENPLPDPILKKKRDRDDFWLGLVGSIFINCIGWLIFSNLFFTPDKVYGTSSTNLQYLTCLPWVLNIGAILAAMIRQRYQIAKGILVSYAVVFVLMLVCGIVSIALCYYSYAKTQ